MNNTDAYWRRGSFLARCKGVAAAAAIGLTACGGSDQGPAPPTTFLQSITGSEAASSASYVAAVRPGVTPFIRLVDILNTETEYLAGAEFTIAPKPGSVSKPVHVRYSMAALNRESHMSQHNGLLTLPVFGLYAGWVNQVSVQLDFLDGSTRSFPVTITTPAYTDPNGIYDHPTIVKPRAAGSALGFDFFVIKSGLGTPVIVDTDSVVRWVSTGVSNSGSSAVIDDGFLVGSGTTPTLYRLGFDGSLAGYNPAAAAFYEYHHNFDYGKVALFAEVNDYDNGVPNIESTLVEIDTDGTIDNTWDLAEILSTYMSSQGDDASAFVRPGVDWFHMNAATYDPNDDSIVVSSRENFLIKLDYSTGNIKWILGDPTKYWYTFPSLRAKALTLEPGGLYPIGQHGVSITSNGLVMVFNDGLNSANQPPGAPTGERRTFSAVSAYSIDPVGRTAQEAWRFDYGQTIFSPICSSSYEAPGSTFLVDFATADNETHARLVGLDSAHNVVFDFQYDTQFCDTSWNAVPIALDNFSIL